MASNFCDQTKDYRQGDGTTVLFNFTFEYYRQSEVNVSLYDKEIEKFIKQDRSTWEFENTTTIRFFTPPPLIKDKDGEPIANVMIFRMTDISTMQATFYPGSAIRAQDLNDNFEQLQSSLNEANCTLSDLEVIIEGGGGDKGVPPTTRFNTTATTGQTIVNVNPTFLPGQELVFINGAEQAKDIDYNVLSSAQVVFTQPLLAGDVIDIISYNNIQVVEVCSEFDTIPYSRQAFTSTAGQTVYTCSPKYTATKETVYLNGALLQRNVDYRADDDVTVTLTMPALVGDVVEVHCGNYYAAGVETPTTDALKYTYPGGVEQTVQQRLEQYVSVKDFGAVGDGVADDTAAIQAAVAYILSTCSYSTPYTQKGPAKSLYFPSGTYKATSFLNIVIPPDTSGVTIFGDGTASKLKNIGFTFQCWNANISGLQFTNGDHHIVRDPRSYDGVSVSGPRFLSVTNIYSYSATGNAFQWLGDPSGGSGSSNMIATCDNIQDVIIQNAGGNGIEINATNNLQLSNVEVKNSYLNGLLFERTTGEKSNWGEFKAVNCTFSSNARASKPGPYSTLLANARFSGNSTASIRSIMQLYFDQCTFTIAQGYRWAGDTSGSATSSEITLNFNEGSSVFLPRAGNILQKNSSLTVDGTQVNLEGAVINSCTNSSVVIDNTYGIANGAAISNVVMTQTAFDLAFLGSEDDDCKDMWFSNCNANYVWLLNGFNLNFSNVSIPQQLEIGNFAKQCNFYGSAFNGRDARSSSVIMKPTGNHDSNAAVSFVANLDGSAGLFTLNADLTSADQTNRELIFNSVDVGGSDVKISIGGDENVRTFSSRQTFDVFAMGQVKYTSNVPEFVYSVNCASVAKSGSTDQINFIEDAPNTNYIVSVSPTVNNTKVYSDVKEISRIKVSSKKDNVDFTGGYSFVIFKTW